MKERLCIKVPKIKERVVWGFSPVTRTKQSKKKYSRAAYKRLHDAVYPNNSILN